MGKDQVSDSANLAISKWMLKHSYATGHGDTVEDLLNELDWQARERGAKWMREKAAKELEAEAYKLNRLRDPGMANNARKYAHKIRSLPLTEPKEG